MKLDADKAPPGVGARVTTANGRRVVVKRHITNGEYVVGFEALPVQDDHGSGRLGRRWRDEDLLGFYTEDENASWVRGWSTRAAKAFIVAHTLRRS